MVGRPLGRSTEEEVFGLRAGAEGTVRASERTLEMVIDNSYYLNLSKR